MKLYKVYAKETFSFNVLKTYYKMTALWKNQNNNKIEQSKSQYNLDEQLRFQA